MSTVDLADATASLPTLRFVDRVNPATRLAAAMVLTTPLLLTVDWVSAAIALGIQLVLFALAGVRIATEKQLAGDTARWGRSVDVVSRPLQPNARR